MCKKLIYLTSFILLLGLAGNAMAQIDPATVTTGHAYLLDDVNDVDGTAPDDSANDNTGIIVGDPNVVDGLAGKALQFDGVDDGVDIPDSQFINVTGGPFPNRTVMAVFNCADVNKPEKQTVFEEGGLTRGLTIYVHEGLVYVGGWNKAEYQWNPGSWMSAPIGSNEWHAVALVIRDGADAQEDDKFEMWMDGELIGKAPGGQIYNHGNDNAIGYTNQNNVFHDGDGSGDGWFFEGIVDEVWILNDALTKAGLNALREPVGEPLFLDPPDGFQIEATSEMLQWRPGELTTSHNVYMGTNLDEVAAGTVPAVNTTQSLVTAGIPDGPIPEGLVPDTIYYWRVESVNDVNPESPWSSEEILSIRVLPRRAFDPSPSDGSKIPDLTVNLTWTAGWSPIMHQTYFGTDPDQVAAAAGAPLVMDIGFDPGPLETFTTYYWRVDEFYGIETVKGPVWSFSAPEYLVISDEETTLDYDNSAEPFVTEFAFDTPQDLTYGGVSDITLRFHGKPGSEGSASFDEATGTYTITGSGADIWGTSDEFHYAYRELTGDAVMVARVADNGSGTNEWAKGGVMIRQSLDAGSTHRYMPITGGGGNGASFQGRPVADDSSVNVDSGEVVAPPYWVKLERVGNDFSGSISPDGVTWTQLGGAETIEMTDPVLIGLAVTSHAAGELRTFTFDNVDIVGNISADDASTDIGIPFNTPEPIYVALEDSTGAVAAVTYPYAEPTMINTWRDWRIPLSEFAGVDLTNAAKLYIGIGDGEPGGSGSIRVDDIRVVMPEITDPDLLIYYNFESGEGTTVVDRSGHGNHSQFFGNPEWATGIFGGALAVDIADLDYIETVAPLNIVSNTVTVAGWVKHDESPAAWSGIFTHRGTTPGCLGLQHNGVELRYMWGADVYWDVSSGLEMPNGEWYFAAIAISPDQGKFYLNGIGADQTFTNVAPHEPTNFDSLIRVGRDHNDDRIMTSLIDEVRFFNRTLTDDEILELMRVPVDVTAPGDIVQGVPNDGLMDGDNFGWPGAETPDLATDDDIGTKFLHFKGELEPTGFQVTPLDGPSFVTGLTFTTANDAEPRDPVAFELSGSNEGIDGPYTLIARGNIVDFAQADAWPRFTKNKTPISFDNDVAYAHYQVLFPAIRDAASANSMQIAEVELLGVPAPASPVGHWMLDDGEGTVAVDSSGNGNDGILIGTAMSWMPDDGMIGGALSFDGTASGADYDYVEISTADISLAAGTIAMWGKLPPDPQLPDTRYFVGHTTIPAWSDRIQLYMDNADTVLDLGLGDSHARHQDIMSLTTETWYHVALTWDGGSYVVYVNGEEKANGSYTGLDSLNTVADIGNDGNTAADGRYEAFNGLLDDVRIYDQALSEAEVAELAGL